VTKSGIRQLLFLFACKMLGMTPRTAGNDIGVVTILGVPIHSVSMVQTMALVHQFMARPSCNQIATVNPEFVMRAQQDPGFMTVLQNADLCIADGIGLLYASRWLGTPLPERVPGSELVYRLAEEAAQHGWRLFLLGAAPGVAEEAAAVFQARYPELIIAGTYAGSPDLAENDRIVDMIEASYADLLFVAYGAPKQDKWIARNRTALSGVRLAIGVGGSLDFVAGRAQRAPAWVQNIGLEWLHRLVKEPWRWRRMLALPRFATRVLLTPRGQS
jgi:N-acetylglucosaminyldiphosphoundecaprenol N-acetyl-beta-D-mannosaminyltransferase